MVEIFSFASIIFLMIDGYLGADPKDKRWSTQLRRELLDIYHGSKPFEEGHLGRMKQEWDSRVPQHANQDKYKLRRSAWNMMRTRWNKWQKRPEAEREQMERTLQIIFEETDNGQPDHERRMLDNLLKIYPEYTKEFETMRTVVHTWWRDNIIHLKGADYKGIPWTDQLSRQLLDIYHDSKPFEKGYVERMKQEWDSRVPQHANQDKYKLRRSAWDMMRTRWNKWQRRSAAEQERMERNLPLLFEDTNNGEPNHERRMLDKLLEVHPEYRNEFEIMRTVVHTWWQKRVLHDGELSYHQVKWTPELKADLLYIIKRVRTMKSDTIQKRVKSRWLRMHSDLNVRDNSLLNYAYKLENSGYESSAENMRKAKEKYDNLFSEEGGETTNKILKKKGKREMWTEQQKADAIFMHAMLQSDKKTLGRKMKQIWDTMCEQNSRLSVKDLLSRVSRLKSNRYEPSNEHLERAKVRFEKFAPIAIQKERLTHKKRPLEIREGHEPSQHYHDIPGSSYSPHINLELTLGRSLSHPTIDESGPSHTKSDHHPHTDYHNGSSNYSQSDQILSGSQLQFPNYQWHQGGSSSQSH